MKIVEKPWGTEFIFGRVPGQYVGKILFVEKGEVLSRQYHEKKEETLLIFSGAVQVEIDGKQHYVDTEHDNPIDVYRTFHIPPGTIHRIRALEDSHIFEVSTDHLDDVVRLEDNYGRI